MQNSDTNITASWAYFLNKNEHFLRKEISWFPIYIYIYIYIREHTVPVSDQVGQKVRFFDVLARPWRSGGKFGLRDSLCSFSDFSFAQTESCVNQNYFSL